jgi:hypothetical protein
VRIESPSVYVEDEKGSDPCHNDVLGNYDVIGCHNAFFSKSYKVMFTMCEGCADCNTFTAGVMSFKFEYENYFYCASFIWQGVYSINDRNRSSL